MSPEPIPDNASIEAAILQLTGACAPGKSISPSDAAQALAPNWQPLLGPVRRAAARLAQAGQIDILRKGKPVDPAAEIKGVIRLRTAIPQPQSPGHSSAAAGEP
jgi:hypothetical protein